MKQLFEPRPLYLVIDPMPGIDIVLPKVKAALAGGVDMIQLWNHWSKHQSKEDFITRICAVAQLYHVPVLIHEEWKLLQTYPLDGVHFDSTPHDFHFIQQSINRPFIAGITCGNDEGKIQWAIRHQLQYISFCSMYPSATANSCELVNPKLVKKICRTKSIHVYVAGGITLDNVTSMLTLGIDGIAVVSPIMQADNPRQTAQLFKRLLILNKIV